MKQKKLFANAAAKVLALAAAVMMTSMVFTACSSDNDDPTPAPKPEPEEQVVTIDGMKKPVLSAQYRKEGVSGYFLYLNLNADGSEYIMLTLSQTLHITGQPINLTKKEKGYVWPWEVAYILPDNTFPINTSGNPTLPKQPVFTTGSLIAIGSPLGSISIKLENGRVVGKDGNMHTLTISYSGTMTEFKH